MLLSPLARTSSLPGEPGRIAKSRSRGADGPGPRSDRKLGSAGPAAVAIPESTKLNPEGVLLAPRGAVNL
jgi:hypothetical protein